MNTTLTEHNISIAILRGCEFASVNIKTGEVFCESYCENHKDSIEISLPEPQKAGTETQKVSYARSEAKEIVSNLNSK